MDAAKNVLTKMCPHMKEARKHKGGQRVVNKRLLRHWEGKGHFTVFVSIKLLIQTQHTEAYISL